MRRDSRPDVLTLSNTQAKDLAGRAVKIGDTRYVFKSFDPSHPGQPPWRSGAEGKAYPLLGEDVAVSAYLKFFTRPTQKRLDRTAWLIGQQMHTWLPQLVAAPMLWTDTRHGYHGAPIDFQFAAYLAKAVPGETWLECKSRIVGGEARFPEDLRWCCLTDLLLALAAMERAELIHGDLSPNNVVIDVEARPGAPVLYLIDFDAFFSHAAGVNRALSVAEGGTYGTEGYCPPDLAAAANAGNGSAAPYSDRYGRDMLLLEFLLMSHTFSADDPLVDWDRRPLQRQYAAWRARGDPGLVRALCHLDPANVFKLDESERPSSVDLAIALGLRLPERRMLRRVTELTRPVPAILGRHSTSTQGDKEREPWSPDASVRSQWSNRQSTVVQPYYRGRHRRRFVKKMSEAEWAVFIVITLPILALYLWMLAVTGSHASQDSPEKSGVSEPRYAVPRH
jgi:hypothetical protein